MHRPQRRGGEEEGPTEDARAGSEEAHSPYPGSYAPVCTRKRTCVVASVTRCVHRRCAIPNRVTSFSVTITPKRRASTALILTTMIYTLRNAASCGPVITNASSF